MPGPKFTASFADAPQFLTAFAQQIAHGGLLVLGAVLPAGAALTECTVAVQIDGLMAAEVPARIAGATPGLGVMVMFEPPNAALKALAEKLRKDPHALVLEAAAIEEAAREDAAAEGQSDSASDVDETDGPPEPDAQPRHQRETMTLAEKLQQAGIADKELRFQFLRDPNKQLRTLVLRNPRIGLEEVAWAARSTTLNPEALKLIAEHPEWGSNPNIVLSLVKNPKTPIPIAVRLVPKLSMMELRALAKSQGRPQVVQAAKKALVR